MVKVSFPYLPCFSFPFIGQANEIDLRTKVAKSHFSRHSR